MALKVLMLKKKLDEKRKALDEILAKKEEFVTREADLEKAIEEANSDEEKEVVANEVEKFETEKAENDEKEKTLSGEISELEQELASEEEKQEVEPEEAPKPEERKVNVKMNKRNIFAKMDLQTRNSYLNDEQFKSWVNEYRQAITEKRAITNVGLTIPEIVLPLLRENIPNWSKLYNHVTVRYVSGEARQNIMGTVPEAIWTECCATLNELDLVFNDWSMDCFKVGGFYAVCKASVEDSDYDLASEIILALAEAIGKALDKAILYGRNISTNSKMPLGVVPSLLQSTQPSDYPSTARAWVNLNSTNVLSLGTSQAPVSGIDLFKGLILDSSAVSTDYSRGEILWLMNDKTWKTIVAESLSVNSAGAIVAGVNGTMPAVGGNVEVLNFIPDNVIIFGYFDLYDLVERAGSEFATSEHVRFIQDQIVYKGTARYDGAPIIREAFGVVALNGATVSASAVTFPQDTANVGA